MPRTVRFSTLLLSISVLSLAACGSDGASETKTAAPMPPITEMDAAMNTPAPQPLAASDTLTPVMPTAAATTTTVTTTTAPPAAGSVEERITRLEQSVGSLRTDYDRIMPAFASLNTTNERIQTLLDEIEKETGKRPVVVDASQAAPVATTETTTTVTTTKTPPPLSTPPIALKAEAPVTTVKTETVKTETVKAETPATDPAPTSAPGGSVTGVRIGEHGTKTRFVMDLSTKTKPEFKYDLDNAEKLLLIDLPTLAWSGSQSGKSGAVAPIVDGWSVQKGEGGGSTVAIQLKKNARILSTQFLPSEGKEPARLVMDIATGN